MTQSDGHVRHLEEVRVPDGSRWLARCLCGWGGKVYSDKNKAASGWGIHAAAARRRERGLR